MFHQNGTPVLRYSDVPPDSGASGEVHAGCLYVGIGVQHIDKVESVAVLIARLWAETQRLL